MLGAASIAGIALLPAIQASRNGRLVALASRDADRAREILEPYPEARVLNTYDDVLADRDVDCVYIPLVNNLHKEWTVRALEAGKHVLCEKPLAMNAREAEAMAAAAHACGRRLMEGFMYRFNPAVRRFAESVHDPIHVEARFGFTLSARPNYRWEAGLGGGALMDVGCYVVSMSRWLLGEPLEVYAAAHVEKGIDLSVAALLVFEGGRTASLFASIESPEDQIVSTITRSKALRFDIPFTPRENRLGPYRLMVESFSDSVLFDRPAPIPIEESIANMRALDRIRATFSS